MGNRCQPPKPIHSSHTPYFPYNSPGLRAAEWVRGMEEWRLETQFTPCCCRKGIKEFHNTLHLRCPRKSEEETKEEQSSESEQSTFSNCYLKLEGTWHLTGHLYVLVSYTYLGSSSVGLWKRDSKSWGVRGCWGSQVQIYWAMAGAHSCSCLSLLPLSFIPKWG